MAASASHPWAALLNPRGRVKVGAVMDAPRCDPPPLKYGRKEAIASPEPNKVRSRREGVTLADVCAFRARHAAGGAAASAIREDGFDVIDAVAEGLGGLALEQKERPVLYRNTDVRKGEHTILEALHFEVFMPDRKDLRFVAVPTRSVPQSTQGHFFAVFALTPLEKRLRSLRLQNDYPIVWAAARAEPVPHTDRPPFADYVYIVKLLDSSDARGVCIWSNSYITVYRKRFTPDENHQELEKERMYEATLVETSSAWLYPVEPPKNRAEYAKMTAAVRSSSIDTGTFVQEVHPLPASQQQLLDKRLALQLIPESFLIHFFTLGINYRELNRPREFVNVRVRKLDPPELVIHSEVYGCTFISIIAGHEDTGELNKEGQSIMKEKLIFLSVNAISHPNRGNSKHSVLKCSSNPRMLKELTMPAGKTLWLGAYMQNESKPIALDALEMIGGRLEELQNPIGRRPPPGGWQLQPPPIYGAIYGPKAEPAPARPSSDDAVSVKRADGAAFTPNERQRAALCEYNAMASRGTPGFAILSPPGSGKTTVAAAMAKSLGENAAEFKAGEVQLLLAVQNVAVENLAHALKQFDDGTVRAYYVKSVMRMNAESKKPFDIMSLLPNYQTYMRNAEDAHLITMQKFMEADAVLKAAKGKDPAQRLSKKKKSQLTMQWHKLLRKAKATLEKYLRPQTLLATVDLALCLLMSRKEQGVSALLRSVTRVIIDEASLLTESAFYCLLRLFPDAKFVLIGDDKQLPPFMFEEKSMGQRLCARSALSVALHSGNLPVIKLLEVYRAPPRLVEPYNKLSYDGALVSRLTETRAPLSDAGLVERGRAQLLFIANPGAQSSGMQKSFGNRSEIIVLLSLLKRFPSSLRRDIMIICLYKEQKRRLEKTLGTHYELHTVDSSQGKEKPIVIVLTTRADKATPFFDHDPRCTVAVSRQQHALVLIGNGDLLAKSQTWSVVLESAEFTKTTAVEIEPGLAAAPDGWDLEAVGDDYWTGGLFDENEEEAEEAEDFTEVPVPHIVPFDKAVEKAKHAVDTAKE